MADRPRFGPAGVPPTFKKLKAKLQDVPQLLREEGLDAFEYQAVRWGVNPKIKHEDAEKLGLEAEKNDVTLSLHASYFINLCGDKETVEASERRLIACASAAKWMKANITVFHVGYYGKKTPKQVFEDCVNSLKKVVSEMNSLGIKEVWLGPETMGRVSQFGSLDEVLSLCEQVEKTRPVVDWAHLHAREGGRFRTVDDFREILMEIENRLGSDVVKNLHCHFTKIEFTDKGEKRHRILDDKEYGPDFRLLAQAIVDFRLAPVIISESPILDLDAIKMKEILMQLLNK